MLMATDDKNYTHYSEAHPQLDGVVYYDKGIQPSDDPCLGAILSESHGNINAETLYSAVPGFHKTGDCQVAVMDLKNQELWVSYLGAGKEMGFERSPMHVDLKKFWGDGSEEKFV